MTMRDLTSIKRDSQLKHQWRLAMIALSVLSFLPACTTQMAFVPDTKPKVINASEFKPDVTAAPQKEADGNTDAPAKNQTALNKVAVNETNRTSAGLVRLGHSAHRDSSLRPAVLTQDPADGASATRIIPLSHRAVSGESSTNPHHFTPAETRIDPAFGRMSPADMYPDEYLADGGDRRLPVHYFGGSRQGFDTEDTIAEYSDHNGKSHVRASNRVAVYAPRFGSVRVVEGANSGIRVNHAVKTTEFSAVGSLERQDGIQESIKEEGFAALGSRRRADGTDAFQKAIHSRTRTRAQGNDKVDQSLQAESINGRQILAREQGAGFHQELANSAVWSRDLFPKLSGTTSQATEARTRVTAQSAIGIDDERARKSEIHIVKLADRETAEAGDRIRFTIRFINTGDYDLHDVRVVDNLTPRLEFIKDSVQTDREGNVITEPNGEGSEILTFVFHDALPAHESGTIEFDVRVK